MRRFFFPFVLALMAVRSVSAEPPVADKSKDAAKDTAGNEAKDAANNASKDANKDANKDAAGNANKDAKGDEAKEAAKETKFLQVKRDDKGRAVSLDAAIVSYKNADGVVVDLIGAIHIGERTYYDALNKRMKDYDAVLYELVAERGQKPGDKQAEASGTNPLRAVQTSICEVLGLQFQLSCIDYSPANFVHADLSPEELKKRMQDRGESPMVYFLEALTNIIKQKNKLEALNLQKADQEEFNGDKLMLGLLQGLLTHRPSPIVKRFLAIQFDDLDRQMEAFSGGLGKLIVEDRNAACLEVLDKQMKLGKKHLGIFYGAAHFPAMEKQLLKQGFAKTDTVWLEAWQLR